MGGLPECYGSRINETRYSLNKADKRHVNPHLTPVMHLHSQASFVRFLVFFLIAGIHITLMAGDEGTSLKRSFFVILTNTE